MKRPKGASDGVFLCRQCGETGRSVSTLGFDEFAVEAGDVAQRNVLGTFGCAGTGVGAVAESEFVHLVDHCARAGTFNLTPGQECELAYLCADEEHGRAVLAGSHAGAAADAGSGVHSDVSHFLRDREAVGVRSSAAVERNVAAGLLDHGRMRCG